MTSLVGLVATAVFLSAPSADGCDRAFAKIPECRDFGQDASTLLPAANAGPFAVLE